MSKRICILGANGYIGRHIAHKLYSDPENYSLHLGDKHPFSLDSFPDYQPVDIRDPKEVNKWIRPCDYIFMLSGLTGTAQSFERFADFIEVNEIGLLNVLDTCRRQNLTPKIIFPSTRLVYKAKKNMALEENDEKEFKTVYAISKYSGEQYLKMYAEYFQLRYTVFRICVPYGSRLGGEQSYGTLNHFLSQAKDKAEVVIFGDGCQKRTFIHISDLVRVMLESSFSAATDNQVFNIGGADTLTIRYVAERIALKYGARLRFEPWPVFARKIESGDTIFSSAKLEATINIEYRCTFDNWLQNEDSAGEAF